MKLETGFGHSGECYEYAYKYLRDNGGVLAHGTVDAGYPEKEIKHAWVEIGDKIFEPVENELFNKDEYYRVFGAIPQSRYSLREAMINTMRHRSFGPWK